MVRTRANPAAARKAVAAKAPRKTLGTVQPSSVSPTSNNKKKPGSLGNPLKLWPKPSWQKGLMAFVGSGSGGESSGCSSSGDSSMCEIEKDVMSEVEIEKDPMSEKDTTPTTADMEPEGADSSSSSMNLLGGDIVQLNSDSEED